MTTTSEHTRRVSPEPAPRAKADGAKPPGNWIDAWTRDIARDVSAEDLQRLFTHDTRDELQFALDVFGTVGRELGIIR